MMHSDAELRFMGEHIGYGVFARKKIPCGTITWTGDELDLRFTEEQVARMEPVCRQQVFRFAYLEPAGTWVLCWDHAKYVNHSCDPNCLSAGFDFEFAVRDIEAGEQICDDYGLLNLREPLTCACGSPRCRKVIQPSDADRLAGEWDALVREAFPSIGMVKQPLWPLVPERSRVEAAFLGVEPVPSCRAHLTRD